MNPTLIAAIIAAAEALAQIVPNLLSSVKLLQSSNATQADVDAAVASMDAAMAVWNQRKPPGSTSPVSS